MHWKQHYQCRTLGQKGLHLNPKGKARLALNFWKVGRTPK